MSRIFLSHATEEHDLAVHIANYLEKNNLKAWYAPRDIAGGIDYDIEIIAAIKDCRAFVLLLSRNSDASEDVKTEVYHAVKSKKQVICLDVDDVEPENLSYLLGMRHRLNWLERRDETLDKLIRDIKRIPDPDSDSCETVKPIIKAPKPEVETEQKPEYVHKAPILSIAVIAVVILCVTALIPLLADRPSPVDSIDPVEHTISVKTEPVKEKSAEYDVISIAKDGTLEELSEAINAGADVNAKNNKGATALMYAAVRGQTEMAELLLKHSADVNVRNNDGCTALMFAAFDGHPKVAELLIAYGADKNLRDIKGSTAYDYVRYVRKGSNVRKGKGFSASLLQRMKPDR